MGHIQDRGKTRANRWQGRYVGADGRERTRVFSRKVDAESWLTANEHRLNTGEWIDPALGQVRFGIYTDEWMATKAGAGARTRINVEGRIKTTRSRSSGRCRSPRCVRCTSARSSPTWWHADLRRRL
jgi:hypothetical protein